MRLTFAVAQATWYNAYYRSMKRALVKVEMYESSL